MMIDYHSLMGISVDQREMPDPAKWDYQIGDLDTHGGRDATGTLHRAYVATKINYEFSWNGLEWEKLQEILEAVNRPEFTLTAPDPRTYNDTHTGRYYVGDRSGSTHFFWPEKNAENGETTGVNAVFTLKLKFIEY